ncbi:MAG: tryptophan-rich sensory protein [Planctomycetota bacterium]|jgi:benzodiazapine receptor|nr:tryptophan-rich sensory protein [Planctomycetota bacterium]
MAPPSVKRQIIGLGCWLVACFAAAAVGATASVQAKSFYGLLEQPAWAPPPWLFGPVWTALYAMMAIAAWLVWRRGGYRAQPIALSLFVAQLVLNALWSWIFFAWQCGGLALVDIVVLWGLIVATLICFWRARPLAGALLIPYLLWVSFATVLNYALWRLNPEVLG